MKVGKNEYVEKEKYEKEREYVIIRKMSRKKM